VRFRLPKKSSTVSCSLSLVLVLCSRLIQFPYLQTSLPILCIEDAVRQDGAT
jgi:hypothetical protein